MKNTLIFVLVLSFVWACGNIQEPEIVKSAETEQEWSELALLMRQIHEDAKDWKVTLESDSLVLDSVKVYEALTSSTPTNPDVSGPLFNGFAQNYQNSVDEFLEVKDITLAKVAYNNLVSSCISCHTEYCPGPIKTIKKLRVSTN